MLQKTVNWQHLFEKKHNYEKDDYIIAKIEFYFDDDTNSYHNYKNGETVTMYCSCSNDFCLFEIN